MARGPHGPGVGAPEVGAVRLRRGVQPRLRRGEGVRGRGVQPRGARGGARRLRVHQSRVRVESATPRVHGRRHQGEGAGEGTRGAAHVRLPRAGARRRQALGAPHGCRGVDGGRGRRRGDVVLRPVCRGRVRGHKTGLGQARRARGPDGVVHDTADRERVLQPEQERRRVPGRDTPAAVLPRGRAEGGEPRRGGRRRRPRALARLRRQREALRRGRGVARLVERGQRGCLRAPRAVHT
mmetsp:Transcript_10534/g.36639  ORF Transcript_10534/g.36639 Transcript_10534/m.36639 type:complete len:238 (+) Transcript_10534:686-1399(+)